MVPAKRFFWALVKDNNMKVGALFGGESYTTSMRF